MQRTCAMKCLSAIGPLIMMNTFWTSRRTLEYRLSAHISHPRTRPGALTAIRRWANAWLMRAGRVRAGGHTDIGHSVLCFNQKCGNYCCCCSLRWRGVRVCKITGKFTSSHSRGKATGSPATTTARPGLRRRSTRPEGFVASTTVTSPLSRPPPPAADRRACAWPS